MKKFLLIITVSMLAGMLGAYVTNANALSESCIWNPHQLECCTPTWDTFCAADWSDQIVNSCGSLVWWCDIQKWDYCQQNGKKAQCVNGWPVDPNGPYYVCQSPTVAKNLYGNTRACAADETCLTFQWCVKKDVAQCSWQCGWAAPWQPSFSRWNNCSDTSQICPGWCENGQCKPWVCPQPQAWQQRCAWWWDVINGCGETVEKCAVWYTCLASATAQDCHCVPDPRPDLCLNIPDKQLSIPAGMVRDGAGNCVSPNPCAGTNFSLSTTTPWADQDVTINCQMSDGGWDIYSTDQMWNHQSQKWETRVQNLWNGIATLAPDSFNLKVNESTKITCVNPRKKDAGGNPIQCGEQGMTVIPPQCNRHYNVNEPHTSNHRITLGQNISFKCDVAWYGAWIWLYKVWTPQSMWESRLSLGLDTYIAGIVQKFNNPSPFWRDDEYFEANYSTGWWWYGNRGGRFYRGNYESNNESVSWVLISENVAKGEYTFQPQEEWTFFAVCFPRNRNGGAYPAWQDILQCGPSQYIVVDGTGNIADVELTKSVDRPTFPNVTWEIIIWTLRYINLGPQDATNVSIIDTLPDGLVYDGVFDVTNTPFSSIKLLSGNKIEWKFSSLVAANQSGSIVFRTKYIGWKSDKTKLINVATIYTSSPWDSLKNNSYSAVTRPLGVSCVSPVFANTLKYSCSNYACIPDNVGGTFTTSDCNNACNKDGVTIYDTATSLRWTKTWGEIWSSLLDSYPTSNKEKCSNGQCYKNTPAGKATIWVASWEEINGDSVKNSCEPYISDFWFGLASCDSDTFIPWAKTKLTLRSDYLGTQVQHPWSLAMDGWLNPWRYRLFYVPWFSYSNYTINTFWWSSSKINIGWSDWYVSPCFEVKAWDIKYIQAWFKAPVWIDNKSHPRRKFDPTNGQSHIYENPKCVVKPLCEAVLGDYIRYDLNKNGLQDSGENGVPWVTLDLYECDASVRWISLWNNGAWNPNMPRSYTWTYVSSLITTSTWYYLFNVDPNKLYYVTSRWLPTGYGFTKQFVNGYATDGQTNSNFDPLTLKSTCESAELAIDGGIVPTEPVSCNSVQFTIVPNNTGARIDYTCNHSGATTASFKLMSGSTTVATVNGFTGSVFAVWGNYTGVCILDGSISYGVVAHVPPSQVLCAYRQHKTNLADICAVKNALSPFSDSLLNLANLVLMPDPIPYCTDKQNDNTTDYACIDSPVGSKIYTQDPGSCTKPIVVGGNAQLGDRVWFDANYNGIQDTGESGVAGATMKLYTCTNTLVATGTTNAAGMYLFTGLLANQYKVTFDLPSGYNKFTYKNTTGTVYTGANDSNVWGTVWTTDCITLGYNESNLTIDAGVYKDGCSSCGWNNLCGNGKLEPSWKDTIVGTADDEECDDGNVVSGDKCSRTCKIETSCTRCGGGWSNTTGKITKNEKGGYIDPPNVMVWEYLPYRWNFDKASDIEFTEDCNIWAYNPGVTYVVNSRDNRWAICEFYLVDGKWTKSKIINHYCDERRNLTDWRLFNTYFEGVSKSILKNYNGSSGASFISPSNWTTSLGWEFNYLGEYNLVWDKTTYHTCEAQFRTEYTWEDKDGDGINETTGSTTVFDKYTLSKEWISDMDIKMPFTVTKPYMTQQNGLSASAQDADIMNKIIRINGRSILETNPTSTIGTSYKWSSNLGYLVDSFVKKYTELAKPLGMNTSVPGLLVSSIKKVPNGDIYVIWGNESKIIDSAGTLWKKTIIVPNGDITVVWDIKNNILLIVPNGNIILKPDFNGDSYSYPRNQTLKGIYISKKVISDQYWNNELMKSWVFGWQLKIDWLIVNLATDANAIKDLTNARRSTLKDWFDSSVSRIKLVQEGSSLQIATSPSLWTSLPPGANELMKELQAFK